MRTRRKSVTSNGDNLRSLHVVMLGQDGVGKSALTVRLLTKRFIGEYDKTLESAYRYVFETDQEQVPLDVLDTAGRNTKRKLEICAESSDIFVVLYSITDKKSFTEAARIGRLIRRTVPLSATGMVLVGTKSDLEHLRDVKRREGEYLARQMNCSFYEISISESSIDTINMFTDIIRKYLDAHPGALIPGANTSMYSSATGPRGSSGSLERRASAKTLSIMNGIRTTFARRKSIY
ncbi:ras-related and estrogen-regulated growth inhibitor [Exaiptasia diaphana]|uniref:small monomeric GTPase n=1 Tax=Exaiptasia diaphana TaxID=2652724 RepID=A0A913WXF9_EXADI|nr:ras-related and estrogen-regulated growth inhibitor [Exaiptasia diaphana]KXJ17115.1 Ras-related and estrogen-regulated growth inhibitor [Exaiptasia diaphana]